MTLGKRHALRHGHTSGVAGQRASPTYRSWQAMHARCGAAERENSGRYRDRGILICKDWRSFDKFLAAMGERPTGTSLDRIDNSAGYSKDNCRWATATQQTRNRRATKLTLETATQIAVRRLRGEPCSGIARDFGVCESLPREIARGRLWVDALAAAKEIVDGAN